MNRKRTNRVLAITLILVMAVAQFSFAADLYTTDAVLSVNNATATEISPNETGTLKYDLMAEGKLDGDATVTYVTGYQIDANGVATATGTADVVFKAQAGGTVTFIPVSTTVTVAAGFNLTQEIVKSLDVVSGIVNTASKAKLTSKDEIVDVTIAPEAVTPVTPEEPKQPENPTPVDLEAPVFTFVPADITVEAAAVDVTPVSAAELGTATATDNSGTVTVSNNAPAAFPYGTTTVTWTATDANNNSTTATQNVTIVDRTKPVLTIPADIKKEATDVTTPVDLGTASATDIFAVTVTNDAPAAFALGTTQVTYTATDANGNSSTGVQNVTIVDTTAPKLTVPADVTVTLTGPLTQVDLGIATATDIFGAIVTNDAPADGFKVGTTQVIWTATDTNGNVSTAIQKVKVKYNYGGVLQPINANGTSVFKIGSTLPVKFQLKNATGSFVPTAVAKISVTKLDSVVNELVNETSITLAASAGDTFRYDATGNQYIYNLSTKNFTTGTYRIKITLDDGNVYTVDASTK